MSAMACRIETLSGATSPPEALARVAARTRSIAPSSLPTSPSEVVPRRWASDCAMAPWSDAPGAGKKVVITDSQIECTARCSSAPKPQRRIGVQPGARVSRLGLGAHHRGQCGQPAQDPVVTTFLLGLSWYVKYGTATRKVCGSLFAQCPGLCCEQSGLAR